MWWLVLLAVRSSSLSFFLYLCEVTSDTFSSSTITGSDLPKQEEQLGEGVVKVFPYNFSQNGLVAYKNGELLNIQTMSQHIGEDNVKRIVNWTLKYIADLDIPIKVRKYGFVMFAQEKNRLQLIDPLMNKPQR